MNEEPKSDGLRAQVIQFMSEPVRSGPEPEGDAFCHLVNARIGTENDEFGNDFVVRVMSPDWPAQRWSDCREDALGLVVGLPDVLVPASDTWFMKVWDEEVVRDLIERICERVSPAPTWQILENG